MGFSFFHLHPGRQALDLFSFRRGVIITADAFQASPPRAGGTGFFSFFFACIRPASD
jgi:hypothetical protein